VLRVEVVLTHLTLAALSQTFQDSVSVFIKECEFLHETGDVSMHERSRSFFPFKFSRRRSWEGNGGMAAGIVMLDPKGLSSLNTNSELTRCAGWNPHSLVLLSAWPIGETEDQRRLSGTLWGIDDHRHRTRESSQS
jgi:hypothetical protein